MPKIVIMHRPENDSGWRKQHLPVAVEYYNSETIYPTDTIFLYDDWLSDRTNFKNHLDQGYRVILDNKGENQRPNHPFINLSGNYPGQVLWLASGIQRPMPPGVKFVDVPMWDWVICQKYFNEQKNYVPAPSYQYRFLMLLRVKRPARDMLFEKIQPLLSDALYSYQAEGIHLSDDRPYEDETSQLWLNPRWYNDTCVSLVSETMAFEKLVGPVPVALSEKTLKPLAMCHPFIFWAQPGSLQFLKKYGFESFPELWDESYDQETDHEKRLSMVLDNLKNFSVDDIKSNVVQEKLKHNQQLFWDEKVTAHLAQTDVIDPIMEFVNA
jgi:hypothetical protein